jgi:hypothetical protein
MTSSRKKPGVAFWATVVVVAGLVGYPLSYGPYVGAARRDYVPLRVVNAFPYRPLFAVARCLPGCQDSLDRYAAWCTPDGWRPWTRPTYNRTAEWKND